MRLTGRRSGRVTDARANSGWCAAHVVQETVTGAVDGERPGCAGLAQDGGSERGDGILQVL